MVEQKTKGSGSTKESNASGVQNEDVSRKDVAQTTTNSAYFITLTQNLEDDVKDWLRA